MNLFYDEMTNLRRELNKNLDIDKHENEALKKDIYQLSQDKVKLQQGLILLDERITIIGTDISFNPNE